MFNAPHPLRVAGPCPPPHRGRISLPPGTHPEESDNGCNFEPEIVRDEFTTATLVFHRSVRRSQSRRPGVTRLSAPAEPFSPIITRPGRYWWSHGVARVGFSSPFSNHPPCLEDKLNLIGVRQTWVS